MNTNALSVANHFIELADKDGKPLHLLGLVKRVYIAHGFALALLHHGLIDNRFDKVEAWKYGPVIPSVYHSFKHCKTNPIGEKSVVMEWDDKNCCASFVTPKMKSSDEKKVVEMVWKRYANFSDGELVDLTHKQGTPWSLCYIEGQNIDIPDEITEAYYSRIVELVASKMAKR